MPDLPGALPASDLVRSSAPNAARIYDCLLGGKDNYQADRAAAAQLQEILPDVAKAARGNRYFLERVVGYLVGQAGIRQIIDMGSGLPAQDNVHQCLARWLRSSRSSTALSWCRPEW
jgi:S-adenosyl methyltransferase